eukprot:SAG31_NODE_4873_length_2893_cov_8.076951_1_plen_106_part_00
MYQLAMVQKDGEHDASTTVVRLFRIIRLVKLVKVLRLQNLLKQEHEFPWLADYANAIELTKLFFGIVLLSHAVACLWYYVGEMEPGGWTDIVSNNINPVNDTYDI